MIGGAPQGRVLYITSETVSLGKVDFFDAWGPNGKNPVGSTLSVMRGLKRYGSSKLIADLAMYTLKQELLEVSRPANQRPAPHKKLTFDLGREQISQYLLIRPWRDEPQQQLVSRDHADGFKIQRKRVVRAGAPCQTLPEEHCESPIS